MDQYAVFGNPIAHSLSPVIHQAFAKETKQALDYKAICAPKADFASSAMAFFRQGGRGANVTVPFKEEALALCNQLSDRAQKAQAVNTLIWDGEYLFGDNTDGVGFINDIDANDDSLAGQNILLLGAGGAARGILGPILAAQPAAVTIANRTIARAERLANEFGSLADNNINTSALDALSQTYDWVINATSGQVAGGNLALTSEIIGEKTKVYDLMYAKSPLPFLQWAKALGAARCIDGLGMLVGQAAESFYLWRGVRPDAKAVLMALRADYPAI